MSRNWLRKFSKLKSKKHIKPVCGFGNGFLTNDARINKYDADILLAVFLGIAVCLASLAFAYERLTFALALVSLVLPFMVAWAAMKTDDFLNPFSMFSGSFALYNGLLLIRLSKPEVQSKMAYPVLFNPADYCQAGLLSAISAISIALAWLAYRKLGIRRAAPNRNSDSIIRLYYASGFLGVLAGFALKLEGFWQAGGVLVYLTTSRVRLLDASTAHSISIPAAPFVIAGLSLMTYAAGPNLSRAKLLWISFVMWTAVLLLQGDRRPMLQAIIAILVSWSVTRQKRLTVRLSSVLMLVILYVGASFFGQLRYLAPAILETGENVEDVASRSLDTFTSDWIMPENTEFGGPYLSILAVVSNNSPKLYGKSYATGLLGVIPGALYPGIKPRMLGQRFADQMSFGLGPAPGWGFNPAAEAYMNFGWIGTVVMMFAWSLFFIIINLLRDHRPLGLMIGAALASEAVNVNRIDFSNVCSESIQCSVAAMIVYSFVVILRRKKAKV